jgi:hypothetical protein
VLRKPRLASTGSRVCSFIFVGYVSCYWSIKVENTRPLLVFL